MLPPHLLDLQVQHQGLQTHQVQYQDLQAHQVHQVEVQVLQAEVLQAEEHLDVIKNS